MNKRFALYVFSITEKCPKPVTNTATISKMIETEHSSLERVSKKPFSIFSLKK
jgi:hypothetical protein